MLLRKLNVRKVKLLAPAVSTMARSTMWETMRMFFQHALKFVSGFGMDSPRRPREFADAPLGFFVLALLIIETFLGLIPFSGRNLGEGAIMTCVYLGVTMFLAVVGIVAAIVWCKPDCLVLDKEGRFAIAINELKQKISVESRIQTELRLGESCRGRRQYAEASLHFDRVLQMDPTHADARISKASCLRQSGKASNLPGAIALLDRVIDDFPNNDRALYNRACYKAQTDQASALKDLRASLRIDPTWVEFAASDEDLTSLRNASEFKSSIDQARKKLSKRRRLGGGADEVGQN